jgi:hypothetical protein
MNTFLSSLIAVLLLSTVSAFAADPHTPKLGTPERKAIVDALRGPVRLELKKDVIFKINRLKVQGEWAFLAGVPLKPNGTQMDYRGTVHEEAIREGAFDGGIFALLRKTQGQWTTVRYVIGATDVPYVEWPEETGAPAVIFE